MNQNNSLNEIAQNLTQVIPFQRPSLSEKGVSIDLKLPSPHDKLTLLLRIEKDAVTIGFLSDSGHDFDWHQHLNGRDLSKIAEEATVFIKKIIENKFEIVHSTILGYFVNVDHEEKQDLEKYKDENEVMEYFYWSEL